jgi:hypothetical protein
MCMSCRHHLQDTNRNGQNLFSNSMSFKSLIMFFKPRRVGPVYHHLNEVGQDEDGVIPESDEARRLEAAINQIDRRPLRKTSCWTLACGWIVAAVLAVILFHQIYIAEVALEDAACFAKTSAYCKLSPPRYLKVS